MTEDILEKLQTVIKAIWERELGKSGIQGKDDFFELNGDSLSMINMLFQVGQVFGLELSPGILFENSTLEGFSKAVHACGNEIKMSD